MLKFLYDEKKQHTFLKFWKLKELDAFPAAAADTLFFARQYARLTTEEKRFIAQLITAYYQAAAKENKTAGTAASPTSAALFHKITAIFTEPIPVQTAAAAALREQQEKILERLHNTHFINWLKNRSTLIDTQDTVELSDALKSFLEKILIVENPNELATYFTKHPLSTTLNKAFSKSEWSLLQKLAPTYAFPITLITKNHTLNALAHKAIEHKLLVCALHRISGEMLLFPHSQLIHTTAKIKPSSPPPILQNKKLTQRLATLIASLYEKHSKEATPVKQLASKNESEHELISELCDTLNQSSEPPLWKTFLEQDVYNKIRFLLSISAPASYSLLQELQTLSHSNTKAVKTPAAAPAHFSETTLLYALNKTRFWQHKPYHHMAHFRVAIRPLSQWQLLSQTAHGISVHTELIKRVLTTPAKNSIADLEEQDTLIIDSDMTMTAFHETLSLRAMHLLSFFCKLDFSDHTIHATPNLDLSHMAWYAGLNKSITVKALQKLSPQHFTRQVGEYFQLYFEHITLARASTVLLLRTSSRQVYLKMKYALEQAPALKANIIFMEQEAAFLFHEEASYQQTKALLSEVAHII